MRCQSAGDRSNYSHNNGLNCFPKKSPTMSTPAQQIVTKAWNFAHVLRDDGLSYMAYTEQITFLLFLKMADELTKPPYNRPPIVPAKYDWESLLQAGGRRTGSPLPALLEELGKQPGMLGEIFKKARPEIQNPATLRRLIVDLIEPEKWSSMEADVKGDIYEGLLAKSAEESPKGAGQYFTPRRAHQGHRRLRAARPPTTPFATRPAGTGGFLLAAHDYVVQHHGKELDKDQKKHLRTKFVKGWELVPEHGPAVHHEPVPARHRRRPLPDPLRRGQPGQRPRRAVQRGADQSAVRQEEQHRHRQRGGRPGEGRHGLRAAGLLDDDEEQAAQLRPARQDAAEGQRPLRHRRAGQRAVRGRGRRDGAAQPAASSATCTRCCGCRPASSTPRA